MGTTETRPVIEVDVYIQRRYQEYEGRWYWIVGFPETHLRLAWLENLSELIPYIEFALPARYFAAVYDRSTKYSNRAERDNNTG